MSTLATTIATTTVHVLTNTSSHSGGHGDDAKPWILTDSAWAIAGVFAWASLLVTCRQIYMHLKYYNNPAQQKWIVRILFMVPVYSFCSWMSLKFFRYSIYFDAFRNVYEALVIYYFLALCFEYLGGESAILAALKDRENTPNWVTCTCCLKPFPYGLKWLIFCKQGCIQFCIVKPVMSVITIIAFALGGYTEGDFRADGAFLWVAIVYNTSIFIALGVLLLFYYATRDLLAPYRPVLKFFIVKAVIFFAFWQGFALSIAEKIGMIQDVDGSEHFEAGELAVAYQNFMICVEMLFAAGGMYSGFTYTIYKDPSNTDASAAGGVRKHASITGNLKDTLSPKDLISDTIRNFSSTYKSYAKQGDDDRIVHAGESDEDESDEDDDMEGGDIGTAFGTLKARPHASVVTSTSDSAGLVDNESLA